MVVNRLAGLLRDLEANGPSGFALANGGPIDGITTGCYVSNAQANDVTSTKFAVVELNPFGRCTVMIATNRTIIIGSVAKGIRAPTRIISPPTSSTTIVSQPSKKDEGNPIA